MPFALLGLLLTLALCRQLTLMQMGDNQALALGIRPTRVRIGVLLAATLFTACAIAIAGPIGFVGFLAAYCARLVEPVRLAIQVRFSALFGVLFLLGADILARWLIQPFELPNGVILALIGAPCSSWWCAAAASAPCWPSNKVACLMNNSIHPSLTTALPTGTVCLRIGSRTLLLHRRAWLITLGLLVALVLLSLLALTLGSGKLTMLGVIQTLLGEGNRLSEVTVFKIRLPRIVAVLVAGAAMGLSGCLVQTLIRNRLATPDMIGVNEGASLAIIAFSLYLTLGSWPWWAAPLGALFAAAVLYALCNKPGEQGYLFVVIGIGVSELMNAIGQFVMSTQSLVHLTSLYLWNMGNFVGQGYSTVLPVGILILLVCPWIIYLSRALGVLRLGPVTAQSLGVNVNRVQLGVLAQAIVVAALGTAIGGPWCSSPWRPRCSPPGSAGIASCRCGLPPCAAPCCCWPATPWYGCWPAPTRWPPAS